MWGLNKGDWPWLLLGLLGAIVAGGTTPSEGVFIANVQVPYRALPYRNVPYRAAVTTKQRSNVILYLFHLLYEHCSSLLSA